MQLFGNEEPEFRKVKLFKAILFIIVITDNSPSIVAMYPTVPNG